MSKIPIREDRSATKLKAKNELTHTSNENCASLFSGEEEQKPSLGKGPHAKRRVFGWAHAWEGGRTC